MNRFLMLCLCIFCILFISTNAANWRQQMDSCKSYLMRYDYYTSLDYARKALPAAEKEFGVNSKNYISVIDTLGIIFSFIGTQDSCIFYGVKSLELCKKNLQSDDNFILSSLNNLANYYTENYNVVTAGEIYNELIPKVKAKAKESEELLADCLSNYAKYLLKIQKNDDAEINILQVLEIRKRLNKDGDEKTMCALLDAFDYYNDQDSVSLSEKYINQASELNSKLLLSDNPTFYRLMKAYAEYSLNTDSLDLALSQMGEVIDAEKQFYKKPNKQFLLDMITFANYLSYHDYSDSLKLIFRDILKTSDSICSEISYLRFLSLQVGNKIYLDEYSDSSKENTKEAYRISKKIFPDKKMLNIETINSLAFLLVSLNKSGDAISILEDALEKEENEYTQPSKYKFSLLINLGLSNMMKEKFSKATSYFNRAIEMKKFLAKVNDWGVRQIHFNLAISLACDNKLKDAVDEFNKYILIYRLKVKPDDIILANALTRASQWLMRIGEWKMAENGIKEALNIYRIKSTKQPDLAVANTTLTLGILYLRNKYYILSEKMLLESLAMLKEYHKSDHKVITANLSMLGLLYELMMNKELSDKYYHESNDMLERLKKNEK